MRVTVGFSKLLSDFVNVSQFKLGNLFLSVIIMSVGNTSCQYCHLKTKACKKTLEKETGRRKEGGKQYVICFLRTRLTIIFIIEHLQSVPVVSTFSIRYLT